MFDYFTNCKVSPYLGQAKIFIHGERIVQRTTSNTHV